MIVYKENILDYKAPNPLRSFHSISYDFKSNNWKPLKYFIINIVNKKLDGGKI